MPSVKADVRCSCLLPLNNDIVIGTHKIRQRAETQGLAIFAFSQQICIELLEKDYS